jgi:large subunit ribosomal protein L30
LANTLKIKLVKSIIGSKPQHRKTIEALGLKKMHQVVEKQDNAAMRGMIQKVRHLVEVEEV